MIAKLYGIIDELGEDYVIINVSGVGYLVYISKQTMQNIGQESEHTSLHIETIVKEDGISLYGFADVNERLWFKYLTTVKGVGAKIGLAILSLHSFQDIIKAILERNKTAFSAVSGVGPKLAERIILELKEKAASAPVVAIDIGKQISKAQIEMAEDAVSALVNLGYNRSDAYKNVKKIVESNDNLKIGDIIRMALKEFAS